MINGYTMRKYLEHEGRLLEQADDDGWLFAHGNECSGGYFTVPTQAQAMRWLREEGMMLSVFYGIQPFRTADEAELSWKVHLCNKWGHSISYKDIPSRGYPTYEAAADAGIQAACRRLIAKK